MPFHLHAVASPSLAPALIDDAPAAHDWPETDALSDVRIVRVTRANASVLMAMCDRHAAEVAQGRGPAPSSRGTVLELMEALFEPPLRAWAWLAEHEGEPAGYAFGTAGFSMLERAYYFNLEALFVPANLRPSGIASALLMQARRMADELGCLQLHWQVPLWRHAEHIALPGHGTAAAVATLQYVFPSLEQHAHVR